jgi:hypothetical protein
MACFGSAMQVSDGHRAAEVQHVMQLRRELATTSYSGLVRTRYSAYVANSRERGESYSGVETMSRTHYSAYFAN